jgi:hypothetical protein
MVLQGCYKGVTTVLQGCYKGVRVPGVEVEGGALLIQVQDDFEIPVGEEEATTEETVGLQSRGDEKMVRD